MTTYDITELARTAGGEGMKTCRTCNQTKPADAYRGTRSACRECKKARRREWYAAQAVKSMVGSRSCGRTPDPRGSTSTACRTT